MKLNIKTFASNILFTIDIEPTDTLVQIKQKIIDSKKQHYLNFSLLYYVPKCTNGKCIYVDRHRLEDYKGILPSNWSELVNKYTFYIWPEPEITYCPIKIDDKLTQFIYEWS